MHFAASVTAKLKSLVTRTPDASGTQKPAAPSSEQPPMRTGTVRSTTDAREIDPAHVYAAANGAALFKGRDVLHVIGAYAGKELADATAIYEKELTAYNGLGRVTRFLSDEPRLRGDTEWVSRSRLWTPLPWDQPGAQAKGAQAKKRDPIGVAIADLLQGGFIESRSMPDYDYEQGRVVIAGYHEELKLTAKGAAELGIGFDPEATLVALTRKRAFLQTQLAA
jgi:hypothetical protein